MVQKMVSNRRLDIDKGPIFGIRHLQCLLVFIGLAVTFALRVNLSIAIVAMTDKNDTNPSFEVFNWDEKIKSYVLGSFFWGYIVTQIPGGYLAQRFGPKFLLFAGLLISSIATILTPLCATFGDWKLVFLSRTVQGLVQGATFPSCHVLLSKWSPVEERGVLATFAYSGTPFGTVIMLATSGVLASSLGWPSIFYASGLVGLIWSILWFFLGFNSPAQCRLITVEERLFIESSLGHTNENTGGKHLSTPWLKVFSSVPFWSLAVVHCSHIWGYFTMLTQIPSYMKGALGMDIKSNALLSALPYSAMCVLSLVFIGIAKVLDKRQCFSIEMTRKIFNTIGIWIPMIMLIALGYVTRDHVAIAVGLLTAAIGFNSALHLGYQVNHIDLAPNFAGTLMGTTNCMANSMAILATFTVGLVVTDEHDPTQWRIVFFIAAGFYFIGNLLFLLFGSTDVQPWNTPDKKKTKLMEADESTTMRLNQNDC